MAEAPDTPSPAEPLDLRLVVLAGGAGTRIGIAKAWLDWRGRPLLLHVLDRLRPLSVATPIVVGTPGQRLPKGPYDRVDDEVAGAGPLAGLAAGLAAADRAGARRAAVTACDYPHADPAVLAGLAGHDPDADVVYPRWRGHDHVLHAVWDAALHRACAAALAAGRRRVDAAHADARSVAVEADILSRWADPDRALLNLNERSDLDRARALP